jgi:hypothetical protein
MTITAFDLWVAVITVGALAGLLLGVSSGDVE